MTIGEVNELFLIDAQHLTSEVQRFARGRPVTAPSGAANAASALGELLRSLGLQNYAACALSLATRLRDTSVPPDLDGDRAAAATLSARLSDVIEHLRHQKEVDDGSEFAAMWVAEYGARQPPVALQAPLTTPQTGSLPVDGATPTPTPVPAPAPAPVSSTVLLQPPEPHPGLAAGSPPTAAMPQVAVVLPVEMLPGADSTDSLDGAWASRSALDGPAEPPALAQEPVGYGFETRTRTTLLSQAQQLHAQLALIDPGPEQRAASAHVWQLLEGLRLPCSRIDTVTLQTPVAASLLALGGLGAAFEHLGVSVAEPIPGDSGTICIDVLALETSASAMAAAGSAVGQCGGRIDASPMGWRLSVPADTDRLRVVVLETESGPVAVHALQFEAWATDAPHHATGLLSLRFGALELEVALPCRMESFSEPPAPVDVWRFELPPASHWPRPEGWDAVVTDVNGRVMPLLVPQALTEGQQYQLNRPC